MKVFSVVQLNLCLQQYDLERHSRFHRGEKPYKCYVCGRPFAMSHHLNNHMVTHTGVRAYSCLVCSKRFAQTFSLKRHMRMHLRAAESVAADSSAGDDPSTDSSGRGLSVGGMALLQSLSCSVCGKIFSSQQTLRRHRCQLTTVTGACSRRMLPGGANVAFVSRPPRQCRDCGVEFGTVRQLNEHVSDVHPDRPPKPYACSDCDKTFAHPYSLKRHRVEHGGEAHVCPTCGKRFAQMYELSRHLKSHHVDHRPVAAAACDQPPTLTFASTTDNREPHEVDSTVHHSCVSAPALPSEPSSCFSVQIAKYIALQDAQTGLANHVMFRDRHLPKPGEVGLLAFAQSLVATSAPAAHTAQHSTTTVTASTE